MRQAAGLLHADGDDSSLHGGVGVGDLGAPRATFLQPARYCGRGPSGSGVTPSSRAVMTSRLMWNALPGPSRSRCAPPSTTSARLQRRSNPPTRAGPARESDGARISGAPRAEAPCRPGRGMAMAASPRRRRRRRPSRKRPRRPGGGTSRDRVGARVTGKAWSLRRTSRGRSRPLPGGGEHEREIDAGAEAAGHDLARGADAL